jgi:hypothetical protein
VAKPLRVESAVSSLTRCANLAGYGLLALGLALANLRLALGLDPVRDLLLARAGLALTAASATTFLAGLAAQAVGWAAGRRPAAKSATVSV